ncbi:MFS transporter [Dyella dinghuensis]|uniref:MFS transporter n=1 Tax=Dyella dinghuensis TaxID=1920169 RepID=A0A3S0WND1_9GAMM|nr:oligopeptide:H+ symporter [Dyella dinghuensis]RUL63232.1 MFS transporter [Dyella dinghuensis]
MNPTSHSTRTRPFLTILLFEFWERVGYYGTASLMVLFMIQRFGMHDADANVSWGTFGALLFAAPAVGGWIGDRVLGARRCVTLGAGVLALGYLLLTLSGATFRNMYLALGLIIVGSGLFKPNASNIVRCVYAGADAKIDSVFTLYYMTNNIAAAFAVLLTPWIKDRWGWNVAFAVCFASVIVGLLSYAVMKRSLTGMGSMPDTHALRWHRFLAVLVGSLLSAWAIAFVLQNNTVALACVRMGGIVTLGIFGYMIANGSRSERAGLIAALVLVAEALLFFIFYQQIGTSLTLFALRHVDWNQTLFGRHVFTWSPAQYQAVGALWIIVLSPPLAWIYRQLAKHRGDLPVAAKFVLGFLAVATGFFIFGWSNHAAVNGKVSSWFMICGYGFYSLGELLVAALGLAMISRYVPARMAGFMMGAFFVAAGIAQYLGGVIANFASAPQSDVDIGAGLALYTKLFNHLGFLALAGALAGSALLPLLKRLSIAHDAAQHHSESHLPDQATR